MYMLFNLIVVALAIGLVFVVAASLSRSTHQAGRHDSPVQLGRQFGGVAFGGSAADAPAQDQALSNQVSAAGMQ